MGREDVVVLYCVWKENIYIFLEEGQEDTYSSFAQANSIIRAEVSQCVVSNLNV